MTTGRWWRGGLREVRRGHVRVTELLVLGAELVDSLVRQGEALA
jgi:hypothetical protein